MTKEVIVDFELDHTAVKAPYVRLIGEETGPKGDAVISNFDIRLVQTPMKMRFQLQGSTRSRPFLRCLFKRIDGMIDCSPFGCRTGFHMIMWGQYSSTEITSD